MNSSEEPHEVVLAGCRMVDLPTIVARQREKPGHQVAVPWLTPTRLLVTNVEIARLDPKLEGVRPIENFGRKHVRRLIHVHCAHHEEVSRDRHFASTPRRNTPKTVRLFFEIG